VELVAAVRRLHDGEAVVTTTEQAGQAGPAGPTGPAGQAGTAEELDRVHVGEPGYFELVEFLEDEAHALDENDLMGWLSRMAPDVQYQMPVRTTRDRVDGSEFAEGMFLFDEDIMTLSIKVTRLAATQSAWAEKPPSRTRRFVTNIRVFRVPGAAEEYRVTSSLLVTRNRYQESVLEFLSATRSDVIRRTGDGFKIAARTIYADQATIGTQNLAIFL
jgi:3-phenylpropionate/cinnamic acid dioxygenase small subunit